MIWIRRLLFSLAFVVAPTAGFAQAVIVPSPVPSLTAGCTIQRDGTNSSWVCSAVAAASQPLTDSLGLIANASDATKVLAFDVSAIATATTRTVTWPNANVTVPTTIASLGANTFTALQTANGGIATTTFTLSSTMQSNLTFTDATYDIGASGATRPRHYYGSGNGVFGGTLAVTGVATFTAQPILSSLTASLPVFTDASKGLVSNAMTGTGNVVMSASPTLSGTTTLAILVGTDTTDASSSTTGAFKTAGGMGIAKKLFVGTALDVGGASTITTLVGSDATDSSSSTTGAFKTAGGLGVAKKLFVGTSLTVGTDLATTAGTGSFTKSVNDAAFTLKVRNASATTASVTSLVIDNSASNGCGVLSSAGGSFTTSGRRVANDFDINQACNQVLNIASEGSGGMKFFSGDATTTRIQINSNGNVGVGAGIAADTAIALVVGGITSDSSKFIFYGYNLATTTEFYVRNDGYGFLNDTAWHYSSDERLKENIEPVTDGLERVLALTPNYFDRRDGRKNQIGFIAQQVLPIIPEAVEADHNGYMGVATDFITPLLVNAIQQQEARIVALEAKANVNKPNSPNASARATAVKKLATEKKVAVDAELKVLKARADCTRQSALIVKQGGTPLDCN